MKLSSFAERLEFAMREAGISQADLGRALGISRSAVNQLVKGASKDMRPAHLIMACRRLRVRPEWLVFGEDPIGMDSLNPADRALLQSYRLLPPPQRATIDTLIRDLANPYR